MRGVLDAGSLAKGVVRLEPLMPAHLPGLLRAATADRSTFALAPVPADEDSLRLYCEQGLARDTAMFSIVAREWPRIRERFAPSLGAPQNSRPA